MSTLASQALVKIRLYPLHDFDGPAKATIIAVHGLTGHYVKTWTNSTATPPFFWLKDGLAKDLAQVRIFTFSYDTTRNKLYKKNLRDHAADLHASVQYNLKANPGPIIFIAHSFGGILVKQVLVQSALSVQSQVCAKTAAVLFFGTPHRGSSTILQTFNTISSVVSGAATPALDLTTMQAINESWMHLAQSFKMGNFYETQGMAGFGIGKSRTVIIPKEEATLGLPNERIIPLDANHSTLVKFTGPTDHGYLMVLSILRSIIRDISISPPAVTVPPPPTTGQTTLDQVKRIGFTGNLHVLLEGTVDSKTTYSVSELQERSPRELLNIPKLTTMENEETEQLQSYSHMAQREGKVEPLFWVHMPLNNTAWVNPCLRSIVKDQTADLLITEDKYWLSHERGQQNLLHSRHFEPSCFISNMTKKVGDQCCIVTQLVIYMPYLHWDSLKCFTDRSNYLRDIQNGKQRDIPDELPEGTKATYRAMRDYSGMASSLHPRRSLDQFFYSSLPETTARDRDQVLSKNTENSRGGKKMVMVDQLWLWVLGVAGPFPDAPLSPGTLTPAELEASVFTCFPRKDEEGGAGQEDLQAIADLRQAISDEVNGRNRTSFTGGDLVGIILDQAVNVMLRVRNEQSLDFLDVFRAAIGRATEEQTNYFRTFQRKLASGEEDISDTKTKREEVKLALEIADIIDELNSMHRLFETQKDVLETAVKLLGDKDILYEPLRTKIRHIIDQDIEGYEKQVRRMMEDARRTKEGLMDLLDLQQKEETLKEVHYSNKQAEAAREQADETEAQSKILFLFTIVTIVFLPLSFFTSYYGMNVVEFTGEEGNTNQKAVWRVTGPISGAIIVGLLGFAFYMYKSTREEQKKRKEARAKKSARPYLQRNP